MYTLKITDENTVVTTVKESIVERSNYVDKIQIVTSKMYREQIDMSDTTVYMKYKLPVSDKIKMTQLIINNLEYEQNYIQYLIPVDAALTAEAGDIEVSFTFLKLVANEDGTYTSYIRKTTSGVIHITPLVQFDKYEPSELFTEIDQRLLAMEGMIKDLNAQNKATYEGKLDYTFKGWEGSMTGIFADRTITAIYDSKIREYTVKYVSKGLSLQESTAQYGSYVKYTGDTPVYTAEESAYKYNLFKGWDKSGFVDGNKTINAVYETCEYVDGYFDGKDLANMTQVELYTLMKMGLEAKSLSLKDTLDFKLGVDYSYGDIEEHEVISAATKFDGTNYIDTGLKIMEKDRDFTIAIDFEFDSGNSVNSTLAQCFQGDGSNGFRLWYSQEPRFSWNTDSITPSAGTNREIIVFRHEAGSQKLYVYNSNMTGKEVSSTTLNAIRIPEHSSTLVFGCSKADDGAYENFAKGTIHWAKVWYADLGEEQCMDIAAWIHEVIPMEVAKFKGYYLSDVASKRANITFVASNLLGTEKPYNNKSTNAGGWADSTLNTWLNTRMVKAISPLWKALIKPVKVYSSIGNKSNDTSVSNCRFYVPSLYEVDPTATSEPYISETNAPIAYFTDDDTRKKAKPSIPAEYKSYWTRSPNATVANWLYTVNESGATYGFSYPGQNSGILLMFSISCEG